MRSCSPPARGRRWCKGQSRKKVWHEAAKDKNRAAQGCWLASLPRALSRLVLGSAIVHAGKHPERAAKTPSRPACVGQGQRGRLSCWLKTHHSYDRRCEQRSLYEEAQVLPRYSLTVTKLDPEGNETGTRNAGQNVRYIPAVWQRPASGHVRTKHIHCRFIFMVDSRLARAPAAGPAEHPPRARRFKRPARARSLSLSQAIGSRSVNAARSDGCFPSSLRLAAL